MRGIWKRTVNNVIFAENTGSDRRINDSVRNVGSETNQTAYCDKSKCPIEEEIVDIAHDIISDPTGRKFNTNIKGNIRK